MEEILLSEFMNELKPYEQYKMHFAKYDKKDEPLDAYMRSFDEWKGWNCWSNGRDEFNRKYIFSLINYYPEPDTWLFGGIWEVLGKNYKNGKVASYDIKLCDEYKKLIGRLKISYAHRERAVRNRMEQYFPRLVLKEILAEPCSVLPFPGYKNIDISFVQLETIIKKEAQDWKNALSIKGIYLITDMKTGKKYVGKASGAKGLWQRWSDYIKNGHGGDVDLKKLISSKGGLEYARQNYKFALLEIVESNFEKDIDDRETYWKNVLLSRNPEIGHNKN